MANHQGNAFYENSQKEYISSILQFIPVTILHHLASKPKEERSVMPQCQIFSSSVLVAELRQFYSQPFILQKPLNMRDNKSGHQTESGFNEDLAFKQGQFLDMMTKTVHKYGGDIIQFLGNSLIAVWPRGYVGKFQEEGEIEEEKIRKDRNEEDSDMIVGRKAAQCALEIKIESQRILKGTYEIFMGVGFGQCGVLHAGGVFGRNEHFIVGKGLTSALKALRFATSEQPVVISPTLWRIVEKFFIWQQLSRNIHLPERSVDFVFGMPVRSSFNTTALRTQVGDRKLKEILGELKSYIPASYRPYLKLKKDSLGSEHRRISMLIANVELEYDLNAPSSFQIIQKIIKIIQQQVYRMEGSFNKIISYDGGFAVVCTWGISPMTHTDDATRAVLAALNIQRKLVYFFQVVAGMPDFNPPVHFGVCTGNTFMGIVGSNLPEYSRREIVIVGETIERAFLFMQTATKVYGRIFVDYETKAEASHHIDFQFLEHIQFSDKLINYPVFIPIDPMVEFEAPPTQIKPSHVIRQIRIHSNPFKLDFDNAYQSSFSTLYGSTEVIPQITADISYYATAPEENVWTLAIKGKPGSGKSLFARCLLIEVMKTQTEILAQRNKAMVEQAKNKYFAKNLTFEYIISSVNPEVAKRFVGAWIPVLRSMLQTMSITKKIKRKVILNKILSYSSAADKVDIIEEIFGIEQGELDRSFAAQILIKNQPNSFIMVKSYPRPVEDSIIGYLCDFIKEAIDVLREDIIFFIVLDNISMMESGSWQLFEAVTGSCEHLILITCIQSSLYHSEGQVASENFNIAENARSMYIERIRPIEGEIFNVVEMEPLTAYDIRQIIVHLSHQYEKEMIKEIDAMLAIIDPDLNTVKTELSQIELRRRLVQQYQVYNEVMEVERELADHIISKCEGNPLYCITLTYNMLINNFVFIHQQLLICQKRMRYCFKTDCYNNLPMPTFIFKQNCCLLETTLMGNIIMEKLPGDMAVSIFILLKIASVIGSIFTLKQLRHIYAQDDLDVHSIDVQLEELENRGIVELLFEDGYGDKIFRFAYTFMRESIYCLQPFENQRKPTHAKFITYLQENMMYNWQTKWSFDKEQTLLLQNLLEFHGAVTENQLLFTQKQPLIIKKVNSSIFMRQTAIKASEMSRQAKKISASQRTSSANSKASSKKDLQTKQKVYESVYVTLQEKILSIYKDKLTFQYKQQPKISIKLENVIKTHLYKFMPPSQLQLQNLTIDQPDLNMSIGNNSMNESSLAASRKCQVLFYLQCREYQKNDQTLEKSKEILLVIESRKEAEEWMGIIEYLRTKASVDLFIRKFGNVKLQLSDNFQPALSQFNVPLKQETKFGEQLHRQILNTAHAQNLFQVKLYQKLLTLSSSKKLKKKLREQLLQSRISESYDQGSQLQSIENMKDQLIALYNISTLHLFTHMIGNACKYDVEEDFEVEPLKISHINGGLEEVKDNILEAFKSQLFPPDETSNMLNGSHGLALLLDQTGNIGDVTNTKNLINEDDEDGQNGKMGSDTSSVDQDEEDDVMDDEEYRRMIEHRKGVQVRFSNQQLGKSDRRMTIYNPNDPNNSSNLRFLLSRPRGPSVKSNRSPGQETSEVSIEEGDNQDDSSPYIVEEPQEELFEENWKVGILELHQQAKSTVFHEGGDVFQMVSLLNDINEKQVNIKRRRKNLLQSPVKEAQLHIQEEVMLFPESRHGGQRKSVLMTGMTPSIGKQQLKVKNPQREQKALALSKILEQGHSKATGKKEEKKKVKPEKVFDQKIYVQNQAVPESESEYDDSQYEQIKGEGRHHQMNLMMSSNQSIAYLQTLQELERNQYSQRRDSSSRHSTISRRGFSKIYKPTPSMKKLPEWPEAQVASMIKQLNYEEDFNDDSQNEFQESLESRRSSYALTAEKAVKFSEQPLQKSTQRENSNLKKTEGAIIAQYFEDEDVYTQNDELVIIKDNVQCIVQGQQIQVNIVKGDKVIVEKDLKQLNLVQCQILVQSKLVSIIIPRDVVSNQLDQVDEDLEQQELTINLTNNPAQSKYQTQSQFNPSLKPLTQNPSNFDVSGQHTLLHDTFSQHIIEEDDTALELNNAIGQPTLYSHQSIKSIKDPSNISITQKSQVSANPPTLELKQATPLVGILKSKTRREKKLKDQSDSNVSERDGDQTIQKQEKSISFVDQPVVGGKQLKFLERRKNRLLKTQ